MRRIRCLAMIVRRPRSLVPRCFGVTLAILIATTALAQDDRSPRLDPPRPERRDGPRGEGYRATGRDPGAPRELVLWRWHEDRFLRLASTRSRADGRFDFGEQTLPAIETWFHVAPVGVEPVARDLVPIERRLRAPTVLSDGTASAEIFLVPAERGGEFRFYDAATRRLLLRMDVEVDEPRSEPIDLFSEIPPPWPAAITIEQVLEGGRRSDPAYWRID